SLEHQTATAAEKAEADTASPARARYPVPDWKLCGEKMGTSKNSRCSSIATKLTPNDSALFPFRFIGVHARAAPQ
ncbi:MAG TPA: hypothetical protein VM715_05990, partial [Candidatus Acidoferrum sp.]|nr:hypothetical protein [Candidatus Acidoferrum sp.]